MKSSPLLRKAEYFGMVAVKAVTEFLLYSYYVLWEYSQEWRRNGL
jgi:hypothetical protein